MRIAKSIHRNLRFLRTKIRTKEGQGGIERREEVANLPGVELYVCQVRGLSL